LRYRRATSSDLDTTIPTISPREIALAVVKFHYGLGYRVGAFDDGEDLKFDAPEHV